MGAVHKKRQVLCLSFFWRRNKSLEIAFPTCSRARLAIWRSQGARNVTAKNYLKILFSLSKEIYKQTLDLHKNMFYNNIDNKK